MMKYVGLLAFIIVIYSPDGMTNGSLFKALSSNAVLINLNAQNNNNVESRRYFKPRLQVVDAATRFAILNYERKKPTRHSLAFQALARCVLIGSKVELDNRVDTHEQVVTFSKGCQRSPNHLKTVWLLQSTNVNTPRVLIADRATILRIPMPRRHGFRAVDLKYSSKVTVGLEQKQYAASCRNTWFWSGKHYRAGQEIIRVWGRSALMPNSSAWYTLEQLYPHLKSSLPKECSKN